MGLHLSHEKDVFGDVDASSEASGTVNDSAATHSLSPPAHIVTLRVMRHLLQVVQYRPGPHRP
jgi:hypothetical protein